MSGSNDQQQQPQQAPPLDQNALLQLLIQQQLAAASGQTPQVQLPSLPAPPAQTQYSNDPSKGPDLLERIGLALGGGSLPGAPAELRAQMGRQALMNFGIGLMSGGKFATPGEVLAGGLRGAQGGLLGSEAAQAGQQEYALNAQGKLLGLGIEQQKARTEAMNSLITLDQMRTRLGLPPLFGPGSQAGPPGGGPGGGDGTYESVINAHEGSGKDPNSSAVGGFLSGTWNDFAAANPDLFKGMTPEQILAARSDGGLRAQATTWLAQQNAQSLQKQGVTPTGQSLGIAHYLGAGGAASVMGAPDSDPVSKYVSDAAVKANPELGTMTVGQLKARYAKTPNPGFLTAQGGGPGGGPAPAPTGPYKPPGASTAAAGGTDDSWFPSATPAPPAGGGGQLSIGDMLQPPAAGSAANVVPGLSAADATAIAKRTGQDVPFGDQGLVAHPSGRVGTAGGGGFGKRADVQGDVGAILAGMQGAGGGAPDTVVQAAGPAAGGPPGIGSALAPPTPGLATSIGPVGPIPVPAAPAQPAAQPQPPAQPPQVQPPAAQPPPGAPTPAAQPTEPPVSLEDFAQQHGAGKLDQPDPASVKAADAMIAKAQTQYNRIQGLQSPGDLNKAFADVQAAQNERDKLFTDARDKFYSTIVMPGYKAQVLDPWNTARQQQQASDLRIKEGLVTAGTADDQKVLQGIDATTESAHDTLAALDVARKLSVAAGNKSTLATLAPGTAMMLQRSGLLSQDESNKLDAQSALDSVLSKMAGTMRQSMGFSRMTNMDLDFLRNMVGTSNLPESRRNAMFAFAQTALERQYQYGAYVREFYGGGPNAGGMTLAKARELADEKLGHIVKTVPDGLSPDKGDLFVQQKVTPGTFYVRDGQLKIRGQ